MHTEFWRDKRVFLTGHTGFKGGWLALWLHLLGAKVTGYALAPSTEPNFFTLNKLDRILTSHIGDITDIKKLTTAVVAADPDIIFHLAAQPLVRYSYEQPVETYATNVLGTVHILEALRAAKSAKILINITTDKCYENKEWSWGYREVDRLGGYDPYSNSKACAELVSSAYRNSYFHPEKFNEHGKAIATARAGNVIGGGDWSSDRLIPDIIGAFSQGKPPLIRFPHAIRPWQHVLEPLSGYLMLAEKLWSAPLDYSEAFNFGPYEQDCRPVSWIADTISNFWGDGIGYKLATGQQLHEANFLKLDISKANQRLQWSPRWSLKQALETTVIWYKHWLQGKDVLACTKEQIALYSNEMEKIYA